MRTIDCKNYTKLRYLRLAKNATLKDVALAVGAKPNTISQYETGKREPNIDMLKKLATFYNCTVDELVWL